MKRLAVFLLAATSCIELSLPAPPPPPGPGSIQGTAVYAIAGRTGFRPAGGARVTLVNTGTSTIADRETGRFDLRGVRVNVGLLLFTFDVDGDGTVDRQRALDLSAIGAGMGRDVALGDVVLSRNATVVGRVLRGDNPLPTGHGGTSVFVPGAPFATATADTGDFVLENLPEGPLQLAFYRDGYGAESRDLSLRGGEEARVAAASLSRVSSSTASTPVSVTGGIRFDDGTPVANARVRFVAPGTSFTTTTDANGAFSVQAMSAQLYQVGIEADGAVSLQLYNVLLLPGANEVPPVQLTRGVSMPLSLDAGPLTPFDGGASGLPVAIIDPLLLDLPLGGSGQLSSARSVGRRPLVSHWRNASDGGLQLTFDQNDTTASSVRVFAPDAAGLYPVLLRVTDVTGVDSLESMMPAQVRVGSPPTVTLMAVGGTTIAPGAMVNLQATAVSTDGTAIKDYLWRQVTGPDPMRTPMNIPTFSFAAPFVAGLTPMTFEVKVTTDLGLESAPATVTLALQPTTQATLTAQTSTPLVFQDGGQHLVQLAAAVVGGVPDASYTLTWSPTFDGCPLGDGGKDLTCPEAWTLSNATGPRTEFFAPRASGNRSLQFTVTATPGGLTAQVLVDIRDARRPSCRGSLSTISYEVQCDEPMLVTGGFDAGSTAPSAFVVVDGGSVVAYFGSVMSRAPADVEISGLVDLGGNPPQPFISSGLMPRLSYPATWVTPPAVYSTTATRPAWLRLGGVGGAPSRRAIVGRATDAVFRKVWVLEPQSCTGVCAVTPNVFENINGQGNQPVSSTSSVSVDGRAYVIVSPENPRGLVEYRNGVWREVPVFISPLLGALGTDGRQLWVLSEDGGAIDRRAWSPGDDGGSYGPPEVIGTNLLNVTSAELAFSPQGRAFALFVNGGLVQQFELTAPGSWGPPAAQLTFGTQNTDLKAVLLGESLHDALVFVRESDGFLTTAAWDPGQAMTITGPAIPSGMGSMQEFDVARFGNGALVAWAASFGEIHLSLASRGIGTVLVNDVTLEDGGTVWNSLPGRWPRVTVEGAEVLLSWQEEVDAGVYGMAGTIIR